jgi:hypothetical protein
MRFLYEIFNFLEASSVCPQVISLSSISNLISISKKLFFRIFLFTSASLFLTSCQVYRSAGRSQFEDRAPGNVNTNGAGLKVECWTQPSSEPLWIASENQQQYKVRNLSAEEIEVCLDKINPQN